MEVLSSPKLGYVEIARNTFSRALIVGRRQHCFRHFGSRGQEMTSKIRFKNGFQPCEKR
jgi:hypothetical protein